MSNFISAKDAAEKWNISQRRVSVLCAENRINGTQMIGNMWIIPDDAQKPIDKRTVRYEKVALPQAKPFIKWVGGKSQLVATLEKYISFNEEKSFHKYAEPFVGGGALLFNLLEKFNFDGVYISDVNSELINAYNVIKKDVFALIAALSEMQEKYIPLDEEERKTYYYTARNDFNTIKLSENTSVQKASLFIFLNKTCFNGLYRVNSKGQFNVPMGAYKKPTICDNDNLIRVSEALKKVTIVCGDYSLSKDFIDNKTLVYLDPPYRPISETASFTAYSADAFNDDEQIRLVHFVDDINAVGAKVILSNSDPKNVNKDDDFFEHLYSKYTINKVEATRMINSNSKKRGKINELLICNY